MKWLSSGGRFRRAFWGISLAAALFIMPYARPWAEPPQESLIEPRASLATRTLIEEHVNRWFQGRRAGRRGAELRLKPSIAELRRLFHELKVTRVFSGDYHPDVLPLYVSQSMNPRGLVTVALMNGYPDAEQDSWLTRYLLERVDGFWLIRRIEAEVIRRLESEEDGPAVDRLLLTVFDIEGREDRGELGRNRRRLLQTRLEACEMQSSAVMAEVESYIHSALRSDAVGSDYYNSEILGFEELFTRLRDRAGVFDRRHQYWHGFPQRRFNSTFTWRSGENERPFLRVLRQGIDHYYFLERGKVARPWNCDSDLLDRIRAQLANLPPVEQAIVTNSGSPLSSAEGCADTEERLIPGLTLRMKPDGLDIHSGQRHRYTVYFDRDTRQWCVREFHSQWAETVSQYCAHSLREEIRAVDGEGSAQGVLVTGAGSSLALGSSALRGDKMVIRDLSDRRSLYNHMRHPQAWPERIRVRLRAEVLDGSGKTVRCLDRERDELKLP